MTEDMQQLIVMLSALPAAEQNKCVRFLLDALEDARWGEKAREAEKEGYLGAGESKSLLQAALRADS